MCEPSRQPPAAEQRQRAIETVERWLDTDIRPLDVVHVVETDTSAGLRWFVRLTSETKGVFSVWLWLHQRRLHMEAYILGYPDEAHARVFEFLLRRNRRTGPVHLCIGDEDGVYVVGECPLDRLDAAALDELFGAVVEVVDDVFRPILEMGFATRLAGGR